MELTPEEKQRIYLEEKARLEAQEKIKAKQTAQGCLIFLVLVGGLALWFALSGKPSDKPTPIARPEDQAIQKVAAILGPNKAGLRASDLRSMRNPKGKGVFVYVPLCSAPLKSSHS